MAPRPFISRANKTERPMNKTHTIPCDKVGDRIYGRIYLLVSNKRSGWLSFGAAFGLVGGLLSVPSAVVLWAMSALITPVEISHTLNVLSNVLFGLTLPLLLAGASCLDVLEKKFASRRSASIGSSIVNQSCAARAGGSPPSPPRDCLGSSASLETGHGDIPRVSTIEFP